MSQFKRDMTEKMRDPEYAYEFGRSERELEIIALIEAELVDADRIGIFYREGLSRALTLIKEIRG